MDKSIRPVFTLELNYKISPGLVTIGKYDGTHPCLTAATTTDKIIIHSPHRRTSTVAGRLLWSESNREIATLNINQSITALASGTFLPNDDKDILIVGTPSHVLVYHVHDNKDILYKECQDGVKAVAIGTFGTKKSPLIFVGGNSSVHGFDEHGEEIFWTAVGDTVMSIALMDFNKDGNNELLVSSEDYNIRVYKDTQTICEQTETEVVTVLSSLPENRFAYTVSNGTVGVYEQDVRLWRVKSKHFAISVYAYDLLGQGSFQLITGWSNGKIDCRSIKTGEVLFKDIMEQGIAGIVEGDYRSIGKTDLICVSTEGEVRGYTTTKSLSTPASSGLDQEAIRELFAQKQALLLELKHYENNSKYNEDLERHDSFENTGVIPANTRLQIAISSDDEKNKKDHMEVYISTNNNTIIKSAIIFAEGIFKGEALVIHPPTNKLSSELIIPLKPPKDNPVDIHIKAIVGYGNSHQFHVFEITKQLPRFSMYSLIGGNDAEKSYSYVQFKVNERLQRICMWINQNFLLPNDLEYETGPDIKVALRSLRDGSFVHLLFETTGKVVFNLKSMLLASDLIQSLATFLNLDSLESMASFPDDENLLKELMNKLNEIQDARLQLRTDIADRLGQIRGLVVRVEDSRMNSIEEMPKYYGELNGINKELINGYNIRLANYNEGVETMKKINAIIQKASRLRVGQKSAIMINNCRTSIKNNNVEGLVKIIRSGEL